MRFTGKLSDWEKICNSLLSVKLPKEQQQCYYSIYPDLYDDTLIVTMADNNHNGYEYDFDLAKAKLLDEDGKLKQNVFIERSPFNHKQLHLLCANVSHYNMLPNLLENIYTHKLPITEVEIAQALTTGHPIIQSLFDVSLFFSKDINDEAWQSMSEDFQRYLKRRLKALSIFDLVGPAMVGPSSSHTAGASRIGLYARHFIEAVIASGEKVQSIEVKLYGSFRDTGVAHKTPHALGGGLSGFATDDPELLIHGDPQYLHQNGFEIGGQHIVFAGYKKGTPEEEQRYAKQIGNNIAEINFTTDKGLHYVTGFSIGGGNIEIRYFDGLLDDPIDGKRDMRLVDGKVTHCDEGNAHYPTIEKIFNDESYPNPPSLPFNSFEEMLRYIRGRNIIDVIIETETSLQRTTREAIYAKMEAYWNIMAQSVSQGLKSRSLSLFKLSGQNAWLLHSYVGDNSLFDNIFGRAIAYSVAVNEINAKSGLIVACPTAGSCGILPGVLKAYEEMRQPDTKQLCEAMMVAGFFGMILFDDVSTAGADYGCQAEVGAASAMAAAALTYLEGGTPEQMVEAFTIAIKNVLGLICDPVAGLVEVPCVKRNGMYATQAISAAMMALSGVRSFISADEVMLTMKEVGQRLHIDYKETGRAGLAKTRDGKAVEQDFANEVKKFFG